MSTVSLHPGDVLSYSAGSNNSGPDGYRYVRSAGGVFPAVGTRWPDIMAAIDRRTPLVIQAYPARLGEYGFGVLVDTYLSFNVASRALQLAAREQLPAILVSQPLLAAETLFRHTAKNYSLPEVLILVTGGYVMPCSLEQALREELAARVRILYMLHAYGVAEVDAACLIARDRNSAGVPIYHARGSEVEVRICDGRLFLSLVGGVPLDTGDHALAEAGGLAIVNHPDRLHPSTLLQFSSWSLQDWRRRTGFLVRLPEWKYQLREGLKATSRDELEFYGFGAAYGFSWLNKPNWS